MKLNKAQIEWIVSEFECNRSVEDISLDTGKSKATVKRALAEAGKINLSWHKSAEQHRMLTYLEAKGIKSVADLNAKGA